MNIKKVTGTVLAAVMLSGSGIALAKVKAAKAEMLNRQEQEWLYSGGNPLSSSSYIHNTGTNLEDACAGGVNMFGIKAEASASNPDQPVIDSELQSTIQSGGSSDRVFRQP
ncbi:hypothetical protein [Olivibacter sp. XZL3]|uniref:hypothetical protein n=1 Tax=Olivibacter sp. XZL3 TaxID=1735116 RepID=UPI0010665660|nr:hypothetical protein [Olivibacter sp. XZL3]